MPTASELVGRTRLIRPVTLMIVTDGTARAKLSSDYAEAWVPAARFKRLGRQTAVMSLADAQAYGLEDGAT